MARARARDWAWYNTRAKAWAWWLGLWLGFDLVLWLWLWLGLDLILGLGLQFDLVLWLWLWLGFDLVLGLWLGFYFMVGIGFDLVLGMGLKLELQRAKLRSTQCCKRKDNVSLANIYDMHTCTCMWHMRETIQQDKGWTTARSALWVNCKTLLLPSAMSECSITTLF